MKRIHTLALLLILVVLVGSFAGLSPDTVDAIAAFFVKYIFLPAILSFLARTLVETVSGNALKSSILLDCEFRGHRFSLSLFFTAVLVVRFVIFG